MATAKRLPSGKYRCQVYLGKDKNGKKITKSFTASTKKDAEFMAAEAKLKADRLRNRETMTLRQACEKYIAEISLIRQPTTVSGYETILENAFQSIMDIPVPSITKDILQAAIYDEIKRPCNRKKNATISTKTLHNELKFLLAVIKNYYPEKMDSLAGLKYPALTSSDTRDLPQPGLIYMAIRQYGDETLELAVLLAMWLTLSQSEIKGLTKSRSVSADGKTLTVQDVVVTVKGEEIKKDFSKTPHRTRKLSIPYRIRELIDLCPGDVLVPYSRAKIYREFSKAIRQAGLRHISFHDLRHIAATVANTLGIPDKIAQERGGWASNSIMKSVYTETISGERQKADRKIDNYMEGEIITALNREREEKQKKESSDNSDEITYTDEELEALLKF